MSRAGRSLAALAWLAAAPAAAADWGELGHGGQPLPAGAEPALAALSATRTLLVAGRTDGDGRSRLYAWQAEGAAWTALAGGAPVDDTRGRDTRAAVCAADGAGHAAVIYAGFDGAEWRLYGRAFDGVAFSAMNDGAPVDRATGGNAFGADAAWLADGRLLLAFAQYDGTRTALFARAWDGHAWADLNGGEPLDLPEGGWTETPGVTAADGGAVVTYLQAGRVRVLRLDGSRWSRLPEPPVAAGTVAAALPAVVGLAGGRILSVALQEAGNGVRRLHAARWDGFGWTAVNGGQPLDATEEGIGSFSAVRDGADAVSLVVVSRDLRDGVLPTTVRAARVEGLAVAALNGGAALEAVGGGTVTSAAQAAGWMAVAAGGTGIWVRPRLTDAPAAAVEARAGGVTTAGAVIRAGRGGVGTIRIGLDRAQRVRVSVHALDGTLVRMLTDGAASGDLALAWDGTDERHAPVASGVYVLVTRADTFRDTRKFVVVR